MRNWLTELCTNDEKKFDEFITNIGKPFAHLFKRNPTLEAQEAKLRRYHTSYEGDIYGNVASQLGIDPKKMMD